MVAPEQYAIQRALCASPIAGVAYAPFRGATHHTGERRTLFDLYQKCSSTFGRTWDHVAQRGRVLKCGSVGVPFCQPTI